MAEDNKDVDMGDNDDDSSSDGEVDIDPQDEQRIMQLESQLETSPTIYDLHVQVRNHLLHTALHKQQVRVLAVATAVQT